MLQKIINPEEIENVCTEISLGKKLEDIRNK